MAFRFRLALLSGCLLAPVAAQAQSVDYSALGEVVGEPVTTSVTGKPQRASELPASAVIITRDEIARSAARDVPGLLKSHAGIDVNRWTAGQSDVAVRGGVQTYNARLLVLVDGRQVYLDHYGMTNWNLLGVQLDDIQQIELVRGPASALFGFNAASGVVNIITRRQDRAALTVTGEGGNHDYTHLAGVLNVPLTEQIGVKLSAGRRREDERRIAAPLLAPQRVYNPHADNVQGTIIARLDPTEVAIDGGYASSRQVEYLPSQYLSNQRYRMRHGSIAVKRDTPWGGLSFGSYANWLDISFGLDEGSPSGTLTPGATTDFSNRIIVTQGSAVIRLNGDDTLRIGGEYRNNRLRSDAQFSRTVAYDVGSAGLMVELHPASAVTVTLAGRGDRLWLAQSGRLSLPQVGFPDDFDRAFTRFSFNAALLVDIGANGVLRLNGGRGYQLPPLTDFGLRVPIQTPAPLPAFIAGDPSTLPVPVWSAEVGYNHVLGGVRLEASAFWTRTVNAIATPGDGIQFEIGAPTPALVARILPAGDYSTYGAELAASGELSMLRWRANYSYTHTDQDFPATGPFALALSPKSTTPRHKANLELGYDTSRWYVSALGRYTSPTRQFAFTVSRQLALVPVAKTFSIDARAGLRLTSALELFAAGENLTLGRGAAVSPIPADRRVRGGVRVTL